jgi:superfamily II DNA or RNA helicase
MALMVHKCFYLVTSDRGLVDLETSKKIGIVYKRHPKHRLLEYQTYDSSIKFRYVALFPNITYSQLCQIEKNCLAATKEYNSDLSWCPNNESRRNIDVHDLWNICKQYFPIDTIIYNNNDEIINLPDDMFPKHESDEDSLPYFENYDELQTYEPTLPLILRPHQDIKLLDEYFETHNDGILHMAPGTGKTKYAIGWLNSKKFNRVIVGVPSLLLKQQWENQLNKFYFGKVVDTMQVRDYPQIRVILYVNSGSVKKLSVDCVILDEVHHLAKPLNHKWRNILSVKTNYKLGLTATMLVGEDLIFRNIIYTLPIRRAIDMKLITDYNVYIARIDEAYAEEIRQKIDSNAALELIISAYMTLKLLSENKITKSFIVCNERTNACVIVDIIRRILEQNIIFIDGLFFCNLDGNDSISIRNECIRKFINSDKGIIVSVYLFGEGVDFPIIDNVCIAENMTSTVRIVQTLLRGNRLIESRPDKVNNIVLPVIKSDTYHSSRFDKVKQVIQQMSINDAGIFDTISLMTFSKEKTRISSGRQIELKEINEDDFKYLNAIKLELIQGFEKSMKAFVEKLKVLKLTNEIDYRKYLLDNEIDDEKDEKNNLPYQPERKFKGFTWSLLVDEKQYYTYEECYERIKVLMEENDISQLDRAEKNKRLHEFDSKIPLDLNYYDGKVFDMLDMELEQI